MSECSGALLSATCRPTTMDTMDVVATRLELAANGLSVCAPARNKCELNYTKTSVCCCCCCVVLSTSTCGTQNNNNNKNLNKDKNMNEFCSSENHVKTSPPQLTHFFLAHHLSHSVPPELVVAKSA